MGRNWYNQLWTLHETHFDDPWQERIRELNTVVEPRMGKRLYLLGDRLPPPWFNGNIELLPPNAWVLVISLNPHIDPADRLYHEREFSPEEWWQHWSQFNYDSENWKGQFFPRLVRLAASCLNESLSDRVSIQQFAAERMLFIEFCPYASVGFAGLSWHMWKKIANSDKGFEIAREVRAQILEFGRPKLVLCNGQAATYDVKDQQFQVHNMSHLRISAENLPNKRLDVYSASYEPEFGEPIQVVGFNQLGRMGSSSIVESQLVRRFLLNEEIDVETI